MVYIVYRVCVCVCISPQSVVPTILVVTNKKNRSKQIRRIKGQN